MEQVNQLNKLKYQIETLQAIQKRNVETLKLHQSSKQELEQKIQFIIESKQYYKKAVDVAYNRSIAELVDVLNSALSFVFVDRNYEVVIELSDKKGKSINLRLKHDGRFVNLKRGTGMGVKTVISAVLHIYYLQCKNSKVLILDEVYSAVSAGYIENFFRFLQQLCERLQFRIIMITHDERIKGYANKWYTVNQGRVQSYE